MLLCDTGALAITDTVGGQAQVLMNGMLATLPYVQSGKLKVIGVAKRTRMPLIGGTPTIAEQGVKDFESGTWQGLLMAATTPPAVLNRLNAELVKIIRSPEIRAKLVGLYLGLYRPEAQENRRHGQDPSSTDVWRDAELNQV